MRGVLVFVIFGIVNLNLYSAYLYNAKGKVYYKTDDKWILADESKKIDIKDGTEITTERASSVEIYFKDGSKVKIGPLSYYKLLEESESNVLSSIIIGRIRNWVKKATRGKKIKWDLVFWIIKNIFKNIIWNYPVIFRDKNYDPMRLITFSICFFCYNYKRRWLWKK